MSFIILEVFRIVKVKDLLHMADDPKQISKFLGNAYIFPLLFFDNFIILFFELYFVLF